MGSVCLTAVTNLTSLPVNWDAWSAIGTVGATAVALFLPKILADREWRRQQDQSRSEDANANRDIASAVERILAYHEVAIAIFQAAPVYNVGINAIKRIGLNAEINADLLMLGQGRTGLTEDALHSSIAAQRIARDIASISSDLVADWGTRDPKWSLRVMLLNRHASLAKIAQQRADSIRADWNLPSSTDAGLIREKYGTLARAIINAQATEAGEPQYDLHGSYY